jgi:hypothetical protein
MYENIDGLPPREVAVGLQARTLPGYLAELTLVGSEASLPVVVFVGTTTKRSEDVMDLSDQQRTAGLDREPGHPEHPSQTFTGTVADAL